MTKDEIKKALECCAKDHYYFCGGCSYDDVRNCNDKLKTDALNVIIEQEREIERLKAKCEEQDNEIDRLECVIKENDERCFDFPQVKRVQIDVLNKAKEILDSAPNGWAYTTYIDELIEEVEND